MLLNKNNIGLESVFLDLFCNLWSACEHLHAHQRNFLDAMNMFKTFFFSFMLKTLIV